MILIKRLLIKINGQVRILLTLTGFRTINKMIINNIILLKEIFAKKILTFRSRSH